jgi:signal transduction histidine kinase
MSAEVRWAGADAAWVAGHAAASAQNVRKRWVGDTINDVSVILIVDDDPLGANLIRRYLAGSTHSLVPVTTGEQAVDLATRLVPDLVLLDYMLPGIDGVETARQLKASAYGRFLPIILLTSATEQSVKLQALKAGADEFLTKPVDPQELEVRVGNLLALRAKDLALARKNVEHAELHRFKDDMLALIAHDLKNPLAAISSNLDFVGMDAAALPTPAQEALADARTATDRATRLIHNLLDVARVEANRLELHRERQLLRALLSGIVRLRNPAMFGHEIRVQQVVAPDLAVDVDADMLTRVIENILDNSRRYTPPGGVITLGAEANGDRVRLRIGNSGPPIPMAARASIFEKFGQVSAGTGRMNLGLGLYFCRLAIEAHGGRLWVEETKELPTVFCIELPASRAAGPVASA